MSGSNHTAVKSLSPHLALSSHLADLHVKVGSIVSLMTALDMITADLDHGDSETRERADHIVAFGSLALEEARRIQATLQDLEAKADILEREGR